MAKLDPTFEALHQAGVQLLKAQAFETLVNSEYGSKEAAKFLGLPWDEETVAE